MVKKGLGIISVVASMVVLHPAFAAEENITAGDASKSFAQQGPVMDAPAPDGSYQPEPVESEHRAEISDFQPQPGLSANAQAEQPSAQPSAQPTAQAQPVAPSQPAAAPQPATSQEAQNSNVKPAPGTAPQPQQLASNHDYQPTAKSDEDAHGHEITEAEESVYENDQQQFEQAQGNADPDKKVNELNERVVQEQNKLQTDSASNDSAAIEEDKQTLVLDKHELQKQELVASAQSESLDEFNGPDRSYEPVTADNAQAALPTTPEPAGTPQASPEGQNQALAMNTQADRVPW